MNLKAILESVPKLDAAGIQLLQERLSVLGSNVKAKPARESSGDAEYMHQHLSAFLKSRGHSIPPLRVFLRTGPGCGFADQGAAFRKFVEEAFKPQRRAEHLKAAAIVLHCIAKWMARRRIPVAYTTMAVQLKRKEDALEESFPGYHVNGLCPLVLRQLASTCMTKGVGRGRRSRRSRVR